MTTTTATPTGPRRRALNRLSTAPFFLGLLVLTPLSFWGFRGFANEFCGSFLTSGKAVEQLSALVNTAESGGVAADSSTWTLNQVAMCLNAEIVAGQSTEFPPTVVIALASVLAGLAGGFAALACRVWPPSTHAAPQFIGDLSAGLSVGLAVLAVAGLLDNQEAATLVVQFAAYFVVITLIVKRPAEWQKRILLILLIAGGLSAVAALLWPSPTSRDGAIVVCGVVGLIAVAVVGLAVSPAQPDAAPQTDDQDRDRSAV